jgi:hypothetical protein
LLSRTLEAEPIDIASPTAKLAILNASYSPCFKSVRSSEERLDRPWTFIVQFVCRPSPSIVSCASAADRTFDFLGERRGGAEEATSETAAARSQMQRMGDLVRRSYRRAGRALGRKNRSEIGRLVT